jgi:hypothetical protein
VNFRSHVPSCKYTSQADSGHLRNAAAALS